MFLLNLGKCNKPILYGYKSAVYRNGKAPRKLIQSEKFGGVASTDSENATLANGR